MSNFWSNNYIEHESNGDRNKTLSVEEYLDKISPYLRDVINNLQRSDTWKTQLTIANNYISSFDNDEEHVLHSKNDNIETVISNEEDEVIKELFDSLKNRYQHNQHNLQSMKGWEFEKFKKKLKRGWKYGAGQVFLKGGGGWHFSYLILSRFILFAFRNYFTLCKIVLCI